MQVAPFFNLRMGERRNGFAQPGVRKWLGPIVEHHGDQHTERPGVAVVRVQLLLDHFDRLVLRVGPSPPPVRHLEIVPALGLKPQFGHSIRSQVGPKQQSVSLGIK